MLICLYTHTYTYIYICACGCNVCVDVKTRQPNAVLNIVDVELIKQSVIFISAYVYIYICIYTYILTYIYIAKLIVYDKRHYHKSNNILKNHGWPDSLQLSESNDLQEIQLTRERGCVGTKVLYRKHTLD